MTTTTNAASGTQRAFSIDATGLSQTVASGGDTGPTLLLPEPSPCGLCDGSIAELSMLLTQADEQDRAASRQLESTVDQAASRDENNRVAQLQTKAGDDESQALSSGIAGIAGGALTFIGGFVGAPAACSSARSTDWHQVLNGVSDVVPKAGGILAGQYKGAADRADAEAARCDAQSQADIRRYNEAHDDVQAANQSIQKVEQFLDQVQQTENATRLSAATYRA